MEHRNQSFGLDSIRTTWSSVGQCFGEQHGACLIVFDNETIVAKVFEQEVND